jgi:cytochrome P450
MATTGKAVGHVPLDEIDLSAAEFWTAPRDEREAAFRTLRDEAPVRFFEEPEFENMERGPGYFAVTRYDDVWHASRNPQLFSSARGGTNIGDVPPEMVEFLGSMINMDDPKHFRMRTIAPLPLKVICEMMGIPPEDEQQVFAWTNTILGIGDPEYVTSLEQFLGDALAMFQYAHQLGEDRRAKPRDDITSVLMAAELDGDQLTAQEFGSFFILLVVAGNETTRNAISHGMHALTLHPDQRQLWWDDFDGVTRTAVEEVVRWASPVIHFRRTATADTEIAGVPIAEGQKVVLWYNSANRDERKFDAPYTFDLRRDPNPQVGFGAGGPHFCLGANLARREISVMFDEIRRRLPNLQITGEPAYLESSFINGIKRMPCAWK